MEKHVGGRSAIIKNRSDKRYLRVQSAIYRVIGKFIRRGHVAGMKVSEVSKEANIYTSTFYDHHKNIDEAMVHFDNQMQSELESIAKEVDEAHYSLKVLFSKLLFFIYKHKDYYELMVKNYNTRALFLVINSSKKFVVSEWKKRGRIHEIDYRFSRFSWAVGGELWWWGRQEKFDEKKITSIAKKISELVEKS